MEQELKHTCKVCLRDTQDGKYYYFALSTSEVRRHRLIGFPAARWVCHKCYEKLGGHGMEEVSYD